MGKGNGLQGQGSQTKNYGAYWPGYALGHQSDIARKI